MISIHNILQASYKDALRAKLDGRPFISNELNRLYLQDRIIIKPLGACLLEVRDSGPNIHHDIEELTIPMVWSKNDEIKADTENKRINLVVSLLNNAWNCHDDIILEKIGSGRVVVSNDYKYYLGLIEELPEYAGFAVKLWTALVFIG